VCGGWERAKCKGAGGQRAGFCASCWCLHHQPEGLWGTEGLRDWGEFLNIMSYDQLRVYVCFGFSNFKCYWMRKLILYARVIYWKKELIAVLSSSDFLKENLQSQFQFFSIFFNLGNNLWFCQLLIIIFNRASHPVLDPVLLQISRGLVAVLKKIKNLKWVRFYLPMHNWKLKIFELFFLLG
jgi:hypothetical protein